MMYKMFKNILLCTTLLLCIFGEAFASHIIGGNFRVRHLNGNTFEVKLTVYRDCGPGSIGYDPPGNVQIGLFDLATDAAVQTLTPTTVDSSDVILGDACFQPNVCVKEAVYTIPQVFIPDNPNGYYLVWERCCRNAGILNIPNPSQAGMTFYIEIPDPAIGNSSPDFGPYPSDGYFCTNRRTFTNLSATDPDGDSLVYSLIDPLSSPNTSITQALIIVPQPKPYPPQAWQNPYSLNNIVGGSPVMNINPQTAIVSAQPAVQGVYVFAVICEEYRNGQRIGLSRLELQYQAIMCSGNIVPEFTTNKDTVIVTTGSDTCFNIQVVDKDTVDSIYLIGNSEFFNGANLRPDVTFNNTTSSGISVSSEFCWSPVCEDIQEDVYPFFFKSWDNSPCGGDTTYLDLYIKVENGNRPPDLSILGVDSTAVEMGPNDEICFDVSAVDVNDNDSIWLIGDSRLLNNPDGNDASFNDAEGQIALLSPFCWKATCGDVRGESLHNAKFFAYDNGCLPDTVEIDMDFLVESELKGVVESAPNVFSPNGDEINDVFKLEAQFNPCFDEFNITIFTRWGRKVFESDDIFFEWDGKTKGGREASDGVYFYIIDANFRGSDFKKQDNLTLIR